MPSHGSHKGKTRGSVVEKSVEESLTEIYQVLETMITKDSMDEMLSTLKNDIRKENAEIVEKLEGRIYELEYSNDQLRQTVKKQEQQISDLQEAQRDTEAYYNDLEQQGRKNSGRISGLEDESESESVEECVDKVVSFMSEKLNVSLQNTDIDIAHRLDKFTKERPRNVIVKFVHRRRKHEVIKARRQLKGTKYTVFEDLTRTNQQILKAAYDLNCVKNSYSMDGKLFAILQNGKKRRLWFDTPLEENFLLKDSNFQKSVSN